MDHKARLLRYLKASGEARLAELAVELGLTKQGTLRHLGGLEAEGLVESARATSGPRRPGRPEHVYRLTPAASDRFPNGYRQLASELAAAMPEPVLERFFERRTAGLESAYSERLAGLSFEERVGELARLATENGHMAELKPLPGGGMELRHCNCPIQDVAARTGHPCSQELSMYGRLLGAEVVRTSWLGAADRDCRYEIHERESKS